LTLNATQATLVQNLIIHNHADQGGGIALMGNAPGPVVINSTIVANSVTLRQGSAVCAVGADATYATFQQSPDWHTRTKRSILFQRISI